MPAPKNNKNASRGGLSILVRIYVPSQAAYEAIVASTTPEERGAWLLDAIRGEYVKCPVCGQAIFECPHILEMEED
jgi:hypothetical protein